MTSLFMFMVIIILHQVRTQHIHIDGLPERSFYHPGDLDIAYLFGMTEGVRDELCNDVAEAWSYPYMEAVR